MFAPDPIVARWIRDELTSATVALRFATTVKDVVEELLRGQPPRPQILIADFDDISAADALLAHEIRQGWFGTLIAVGAITPELRTSLNVASVVSTFKPETLGKAVHDVGLHRATTRMPQLGPKKR